MKQFITILIFALTVSAFTAKAQMFNCQSTGVARVDNQTSVSYYERDDYSFSIVPDREMVVITKNYGSSFSYTGTYKIEYAMPVYDNEMGNGYSFAISRNNTVYVMTMTKNIISFSKMGDQSRIWHFYLNRSINF